MWVVAAACCLGCASGGEISGEDSASFGPGGPGDGTAVGTDSATSNSGGSVSATSTTADSATGNSGDGPDCDDMDGDGYGANCQAGTDCDDDNPDVNPGAPETCDGTDENCDNMIDNGCDCPDDGVSGNCNSPTDLGVINPGDMVLSMVGNVPQEGALDWYVISFPLAAARPGMGAPTIEFAINEGDAFVFDVVGGQCEAAGVPCTSGGTNGAGIGLTSWSFVDDDPGCCTPPNDSMVAWPDPVYIRVYRTDMGPSCATYQLQVSR